MTIQDKITKSDAAALSRRDMVKASAVAATAAAAAPSQSFAQPRGACVLFVKDIEARQGHVRDLLLGERELGSRRKA